MVRLGESNRILRTLAGIVLASLFSPAGVFAAPNQWTAIGPYGPGGAVHAIVVDGTSPGAIYVGTDGGIFKSVDGGASWGAVNNGLTGFVVGALAIDPTAPGTVYAGTDTGVFKTTNGGNEWVASRTGIGAIPVTSVAIDPANAQLLYAGTGSGIFKSVDAGQTWTASSNGLGSFEVRAVVVAPASASPRTVWAGTTVGLFFSANGGATWTAAPSLTLPVRVIAVDPVTPSILYVGTDGALSPGGVFKSSDGGQTWSPSNGGLGPLGILSIALNATLTSTLYVGTQGAGVFVTHDAGSSWSLLAGSPPAATALVLAPTGSSLYAGAADGFWVSPDDGTTWRRQTGSFTTLTVNALVADSTAPSTLYAAVSNSSGFGGGVFKSLNAGSTWSQVGGLPDNQVMTLAASLGTVPAIYAGTNGTGIFRTQDGGSTWAAINAGLTNPNVNSIVAGSGNVVYAATDGGIFRSDDGGDNWEATNNALSDWNVQALAIEPGDSDVVYAGTSTGIYKTTDRGANWVAMNTGIPNARILSLLIDPTTPQTVYAGTIAPVATGQPSGLGVYRTIDGGLHWSAANTGIESAIVASLATDPLGAVVYAGTTTGVFRLPRGGAVWTALNEGLADQTVDAILVDHQSPSTLYAGTARDSVFKATISSVTGSCRAGPSTLCLNANRFQVDVAWRTRSNDTAGIGIAVPLTSDTGAFWFFTSGNVELVVKVVDGRAFNGSFWVFYGALSDVEYTVTVTDTLTSQTKTYQNPQGQLASVADTSAFPAASPGPSAASGAAVTPGTPVTAASAPPIVTTGSTAAVPCVADATTLCLNRGRFQVRVDWVAALIGQSGPGQATPLTSDSGSFWFFTSGNLELIIKVVDGRAFDGKFWVFYGALSDVAYTITVTDTDTGTTRTYSNPQGRLASVADTSAF